MQLLTEWCIGCMDLLDEDLAVEERRARGILAMTKLESILEERKILESGAWQNWHRGEKKINISLLLSMTKEVYDRI